MNGEHGQGHPAAPYRAARGGSRIFMGGGGGGGASKAGFQGSSEGF